VVGAGTTGVRALLMAHFRHHGRASARPQSAEWKIDACGQSPVPGTGFAGKRRVLLVEQLKARPVALVKLFAIKVGRSWYGTDSQHFEGAIQAIQVLYLSLIVWSSILAWNQGGLPRQLLTTVWLIALYFWGMNVISTTLLRYQVPVIGLLFTSLRLRGCFGREDRGCFSDAFATRSDRTKKKVRTGSWDDRRQLFPSQPDLTAKAARIKVQNCADSPPTGRIARTAIALDTYGARWRFTKRFLALQVSQPRAASAGSGLTRIFQKFVMIIYPALRYPNTLPPRYLA
jgi:hypothetical protein